MPSPALRVYSNFKRSTPRTGEARNPSIETYKQNALRYASPFLSLLKNGDFDLVAVGGALLVGPAFANKLRCETITELQPYSAARFAGPS